METGLITHEEARAIAKRFIDGHFNNEGEHPRMSIPADPNRDDDIRLCAYIAQQAAGDDVPVFLKSKPQGRIITCVYCGKEYPQGTPAAGSQVLTEHIKVCDEHPMRALEDDRKRLVAHAAEVLIACRDDVADGANEAFRALPDHLAQAIDAEVERIDAEAKDPAA